MRAGRGRPSAVPTDAAAGDGGVAFACRRVWIEFQAAGGTVRPLQDVDLTVQEGEFVSVVGASGSGKTTLLRVLGGLATPGGGSEVLYRGSPIVGPPRGVVFVFQDYRGSLLPWRTVERNVRLGLEDGSVSRDEADGRVREALELVGLAGRSRDRPWQLSGGMQQRVQLARALAMRPNALLMDEPFGALDAMTKTALQDELLRVRQVSRAATVFVTHDVDEAVYLSDRVVVLAGAPATVTAEVIPGLGQARDQVRTRASSEFLSARKRVYDALGSQ